MLIVVNADSVRNITLRGRVFDSLEDLLACEEIRINNFSTEDDFRKTHIILQSVELTDEQMEAYKRKTEDLRVKANIEFIQSKIAEKDAEKKKIEDEINKYNAELRKMKRDDLK